MWSPTHPALFACVDGMGRLDLWNLNNDTEVSRKIKIKWKNRKLESYWIIFEILFIPGNVKGLCECSIITKKPNKLCILMIKSMLYRTEGRDTVVKSTGISLDFWKALWCLLCPGKVSFVRQREYFSFIGYEAESFRLLKYVTFNPNFLDSLLALIELYIIYKY